MKKALKILFYAVSALVLVVAVLLVASTFPITGNYKLMVIQSGSMEPAIKVGSLIAIAPRDNYEIGEVITFGEKQDGQLLTTHRVHDMKVEGGEPVYITKGDANNAPDAREVRGENVEGRVFAVVPYVGYAVEFAKKPAGFVLIIIIPAVAIICDEIRKVWREVMKLKNKKKDKEQDDEITRLKEEVAKLKKNA